MSAHVARGAARKLLKPEVGILVFEPGVRSTDAETSNPSMFLYAYDDKQSTIRFPPSESHQRIR